MALFGGILTVKAVVFLTFSVFAIAAVGYALGRVTVKGINLGIAGVFIIALLYGCFLYGRLSDNLAMGDATYAVEALKIVENLGLIFFVTSVGFIAGPNFFGNLKRNFKSYVMLGLVIIVSAAITCVLCIMIGADFTDLNHEQFRAILVGILSGALTSTPAFSASKAAVKNMIAANIGIGFWPEFSWGEIENERVKLLEVEEPVCQRNIIISCNTNKIDSQNVINFYQFLTEFFRKRKRSSHL